MKLDGQVILEPDGFLITPIKFSRSRRTASGRKVEDIIAIKNMYTLYYKAIAPEELNLILDKFESGKEVMFTYEDSGRTKDKLIYINELPRELYVYDYNYSENITIVFEEV